MFLVDRIDDVREITDAMQRGEQETAGRIVRQLHRDFESDEAHVPLLDSLRDTLAGDEYEQLERLVDEYWQAALDRRVRDRPEPDEAAVQAAEQQLAFELFQQELRQAYEWTLRPYREKLETICRITNATEAQREQIRDAVIDFVRESRLSPTEAQYRRLTDRIHDALDESQRRRPFEAAFTCL